MDGYDKMHVRYFQEIVSWLIESARQPCWGLVLMAQTGTSETHGEMQEQCIRFDEKIKQRGKELGELDRQEFLDIALECDMNVPE